MDIRCNALCNAVCCILLSLPCFLIVNANYEYEPGVTDTNVIIWILVMCLFYNVTGLIKCLSAIVSEVTVVDMVFSNCISPIFKLIWTILGIIWLADSESYSLIEILMLVLIIINIIIIIIELLHIVETVTQCACH